MYCYNVNVCNSNTCLIILYKYNTVYICCMKQQFASQLYVLKE